MKKIGIYLIGLLVLMLTSSCASALNISDLVVTQSPYLGLAFPGDDEIYYPYVQDAGAKFSRIDVYWSLREPVTDNNYDWDGLDTRVGYLNSYGIEAVMTFVTDNTASWAAPIVDPEKDALNQVPVDLNVWADFVTDCVERYDFDGVNDMPVGASMVNRFFSIANEWPNQGHQGGGWAGTTEQLIDFTNATYAGIQAANTGGKLIMGAWSSGTFNKIACGNFYLDHGISWEIRDSDNLGNVEIIDINDLITDAFRAEVREAYRVLNESTYDYYAVHLYGPVSDNAYRIEFIKDLLPNKPLVSLECGGPNRAYDSNITNDELFNYAIEMNLDNIDNDIEFSLWFRLTSPEPYVPGGTLTWGNSYVPWLNSSAVPLTVANAARGSYWAYFILAEMLENATSVEKISDGVFKVIRSDGDIMVGFNSGTMTMPVGFVPVQRINILTSKPGTYEVGTTPAAEATVSFGSLPVIISEVILGN